MVLRKFIATTIREYLNENKILDLDISNFLGSKNIVIDEYITSGTKGSVYSLTNGNALKVSDYNIDKHYRDYKEMIGENNNYLVDIINVFKYNNILFVEMEKLNKIQFNKYSKFDKVNTDEEILKNQFLSFLNYNNNKDDLEDAINDFINTNHHEKEYLDRLMEERDLNGDDIENILLDLNIMFDGQIELSNNYGLYLKDFHSNNIMESNKTNDYKLIDFI